LLDRKRGDFLSVSYMIRISTVTELTGNGFVIPAQVYFGLYGMTTQTGGVGPMTNLYRGLILYGIGAIMAVFSE